MSDVLPYLATYALGVTTGACALGAGLAYRVLARAQEAHR